MVQIVAVGTGGIIATSANGTSWTSRTSAFTTDIRSVVYGKGMFVAGTAGGTVATSFDGITWTSRAAGVGTGGINTLTYGNGIFVAGCSGSQIFTSTDAITWTSQASTFITGQNVNGLCYGNSLYVAVGGTASSSVIQTSPDAVTWTSRTSVVTAEAALYDVVYGSLFVAVGNMNSGPISQTQTSTDGTTWISRTTQFGGVGTYCICYGGAGLYVTIGRTGIWGTSSDGATWTSRAAGFGAQDTQAVVYSPDLGLYIAGTNGGAIYTGTNANPPVWTSRSSIFGVNQVLAIAYSLPAGLGALSFASSSPALDTPTLAILSATLTASSLATAAPIFANPVIKIVQNLLVSTAGSNCVLLCHFDTDFSDAANKHLFSVVGSPAPIIDNTQSVFGGASVYFAAGGVLSGDGSADFNFGMNDFTIDFWLKIATNLGGNQVVFDLRSHGSSGNYIELTLSNLKLIIGATTVIDSGQSISSFIGVPARHVAITRASGLTRLFVDGVPRSSTYTDSNNYLTPTAGRPFISGSAFQGDGTQNFNGWLDELRILNGTAAWTNNFTPPTASYVLDFAPSSPVIGSSALFKVLTAAPFTPSSPALDNPNLINVIAIGFATAHAVIGASALFGPAANLSTSSPVIVVPIGGIQLPPAISFSSPAPVIVSPVGGATLTASGFASSVPVLASPTYVRTIFASAFTPASPVFTNPYEAISFLPGSLSPASPVFSAIALTIPLSPTGFSPASPSVGSPQITKALTAIGISVAAPILNVPNIVPQFIAVSLSPASPVFGLTLSAYNFGSSNITTASPVFVAVAISQSQAFSAVSFVTATPGFILPNVINTVATALSVSSPVIGAAILNKAMGAANLTVSAPVLNYVIAVVATNFVSSSPIIGAPSQVNVLTAVNLTPPVDLLDVATLTLSLSAVSLTPSIDILDTPAITKVLFLTSLSPASPVFVNPNALSPVAANLTVSSTAPAPVVLAINFPTAAGMASGSPVLGAPNGICMVAAGFVNSPTQIGSPNQVWFYPVNFSTTSPFVSNAGLFTQFQNMTAILLPISPVIVTPTFAAVNLSAANFVNTASDYGSAALAANSITAAMLSPASPVFNIPSATQIYNFTASSLSPSALVFTKPLYSKNVPSASLTVGSPHFSGEQLRIKTICFPSSIVVSRPILGGSSVSLIKNFLPSNIVVSIPFVSPISLFVPQPGQTLVYLGDAVLSGGLNALLNATTIYICAGFSTDWTDLTQNYILGLKDYGAPNQAFGPIGPGNPTGLLTASYPIVDGDVFAPGQANYWAAVDAPNRKILAIGVLYHPFMCITGQKFYLNSFSVQEGTQ